jgi:taurine dioxygenase
LQVRPITSSVGAVIEGVDITRPLDAGVVGQVRQALLDHGVIFFHDQQLDNEQMGAFIAQFGKPIPEPFVSAERPDAPPVGSSDLEASKYSTAVWHSDTSFVPEPPTLTALRAVNPPPVGGDTCWASMYAAYDALSEPLQRMLDGLTAVHSMEPVLKRMHAGLAADHAGNEQAYGRTYVHPLIRVHPETGRKALFYNEGWVTRIVELNSAESDRIIALLREHVKSPEFSMRWHWAANDVAVWDNRCVQHYAVPDYSSPRVMQRVVTEGQRPIGPA